MRRYPIPFIALTLMAVSGILALTGPDDAWRWPLVVIILVGGVPLLVETVRQLLHREFGVDLLALLAIAGSLLLGEYLAGAVIVLMLAGGKSLESFALGRARRSLSSLAERAPRVAHILTDGHLETVSADSVEVGEQVIVKPGEVIPVDGVVTEGSSSVSEADLTGEPVPLRKEPGSLALSGSINLDSPLRIKTAKRSAESQYAQIVRLVAEAQASKAPIHRLADRYAVWFTAIALVLAGAAWLYSGQPVVALAVLVVATPCPLILATPIAIMSGIDRAARDGLITKSGATIEELGEVSVVVFDKTGTLTLGMPQVVEIAPAPSMPDSPPTPQPDQEMLVALAASVEQYSPHILARAVVDAAHARGAALRDVTDVQEIPGKGISG
ncbi:MAG TPA: HAD-IC family P-type ATPase, partial [Ktedonobacterales bacterium]|nr:HAD-IC family P-type ATPase [Ktedonobacterales bacterium]